MRIRNLVIYIAFMLFTICLPSCSWIEQMSDTYGTTERKYINNLGVAIFLGELGAKQPVPRA